MSNKSSKGRLSFDENDLSKIDDILPGPSKPTISHAFSLLLPVIYFQLFLL
jgi:hypothetical protein